MSGSHEEHAGYQCLGCKRTWSSLFALGQHTGSPYMRGTACGIQGLRLLLQSRPLFDGREGVLLHFARQLVERCHVHFELEGAASPARRLVWARTASASNETSLRTAAVTAGPFVSPRSCLRGIKHGLRSVPPQGRNEFQRKGVDVHILSANFVDHTQDGHLYHHSACISGRRLRSAAIDGNRSPALRRSSSLPARRARAACTL